VDGAILDQLTGKQYDLPVFENDLVRVESAGELSESVSKTEGWLSLGGNRLIPSLVTAVYRNSEVGIFKWKPPTRMRPERFFQREA